MKLDNLSFLHVPSLKFPSMLCSRICPLYNLWKDKRSLPCLRENMKMEQPTNKVSRRLEATVLKGHHVFSTVLLDFHGSNDKTGLGDKGKTRVGKSLKFWTVTSHVTALSPDTCEAPGRAEAGRHTHSKHLPDPLSLINNGELRVSSQVLCKL